MSFSPRSGLQVVISKMFLPVVLLALPASNALGDEKVPVRVVPRLEWPIVGTLSPDGKYGACWKRNCLRVVDIKRKQLAYLRELDLGGASAAFSPDGNLLVACGSGGGVLLDLRTFSEKQLKVLSGSVVAFTSDGRHILLATSAQVFPRAHRRILKVLHRTSGKVIKTFPLNMVVPTKITNQGVKVTVAGWGGRPYSRKIGGGYLVTQEMNIRTGKVNTLVDKTVRSGRPKPRPKLPVNSPEGTYRNYFHDLFWDEPSGIAVIRGEGQPDGGVVKVWDIRKGRFLRTLGINNEVSKPMHFIQPGVLAAYAWPNGSKQLMEFDLAKGVRFPAKKQDTEVKPYRKSSYTEGEYGISPKAIPIAGGRLELQAEATTMRLHLIRKKDKKNLVTFVPFEKNLWIAHTPDGRWSGPDEVLNHVSFYRGADLLSSKMIRNLKDAAYIQALLQQHFKKREE